MPPTYPSRPACPRWLTAEKSPAIETVRYIYAPAYLRRLIAPRDRNGTPRTRASPLASAGSASRPPALVTKIIAHKRIPFPRGISPLRSDCRPRSGRNDIVDKRSSGRGLPRPYRRRRCESYTNVISSVSREIPHSRNGTLHIRLTPNTRPQGLPAAPAKCPRRLTALKPSPLGEGGTSASEANRVANEGNRTL